MPRPVTVAALEYERGLIRSRLAMLDAIPTDPDDPDEGDDLRARLAEIDAEFAASRAVD